MMSVALSKLSSTSDSMSTLFSPSFNSLKKAMLPSTFWLKLRRITSLRSPNSSLKSLRVSLSSVHGPAATTVAPRLSAPLASIADSPKTNCAPMRPSSMPLSLPSDAWYAISSPSRTR